MDTIVLTKGYIKIAVLGRDAVYVKIDVLKEKKGGRRTEGEKRVAVNFVIHSRIYNIKF